MPYPATVVTVMIASPGDVATERRKAVEVVHEWNAIHSESSQLVLLPVTWETAAAPAMGVRAQQIINDQLVKKADLIVGVFWTRAGTATGQSEGGAFEEIQTHVAAGKPAMIYFSQAPVAPEALDRDQYETLRSFKRDVHQHGLAFEYESLSAFSDQFRRHLAQTMLRERQRWAVNHQLSGHTSQSGPSTSPAAPQYTLSPEEAELLTAVACESSGTVVVTERLGGAAIEVGTRNFIGPPDDHRGRVLWRGALTRLVSLRLLEQRDTVGEVFEITYEGYRVADVIRQE